MSPEAALDLCRFLHDSAAMLYWGAFAYLAGFVPAKLAADVERRLGFFRLTTLAMAVVTTAAVLPLEGAYVGDGWPDAVDLPTLSAVLLGTTVGTAWMVEAAFAVLLLATTVAPSPWRRSAGAVASGALLASLVLTGHSAMQGGVVGAGHRINDALHVLSAGAWLGGLVPLLIVMSGLRDPARRAEAAIAVRNFSIVGHWIVAVVIATGVVNTFLILGRWPTDWTSPYQALLMAKIALVLGMVCLALLNRYVWLGAANDPDAVPVVKRAMIGEVLLALGAVSLAAVFSMLEPA